MDNNSGVYYGGVASQAKKPFITKKWVIVVGVVLVVIAVAIGIVWLLNSSGSKNSSQATNLRVIFDQTAPIPARLSGEMYGYISPINGETLIEANYSFAERFYGEYAKVATEDRRGSKYKVINRKGEVVVETDSGDSEAVQYIIDQDMWKVGTAFYDGNMKRITSQDDEAEYISYGFMRAKKSSEEYFSRILNRSGKEVFKCASTPCAISIGSDFNGNGEFYAAIQLGDGLSVLIDLSNSKEVSRLEKGKYFINHGRNIFAVKIAKGGVEKQLFLYKGEVKEEFSGDVSLGGYDGYDVISISSGDESGNVRYYDVTTDSINDTVKDSWRGIKEYVSYGYAIIDCDDGYYGLINGEEEVLPCGYDDIVMLPENVFSYYSTVKEQDLFVLYGEDVSLYDVRSRQKMKVLDGDSVQFFENSPFYVVDDSIVHSLDVMDDEGVNITSYSSVEYYGNYFTLNSTIFYGSALTNIGSQV